MIKYSSREIRDADLRELLRLGHRRMRALSYESIETRNAAFTQYSIYDRKKLVGVIVASLIRNDCEDSFAFPDHLKGFSNNRSDGVFVQDIGHISFDICHLSFCST